MGLFKSVVGAIRDGLRKTAAVFGAGLRSLLRGRQLSEELIDEIERRLIAADVGVKATREIIDALRADFRAARIERGDDALAFLKTKLKARWTDEERRIATATAKPTMPVRWRRSPACGTICLRARRAFGAAPMPRP